MGQTNHVYGMNRIYEMKDPWKDESKVDSLVHFIMRCNMDTHKNELKRSSIGKVLSDLSDDKNIEYMKDGALPADEAQYEFPAKANTGGVVKYGEGVNARILMHELRHAWQYHAGIFGITPLSPEERILHSRFIEADARAIEFIGTLQCIGPKAGRELYQSHLLASFDPHQKDYCQRNENILQKMISDPAVLRQAARTVFDDWIALSPNQPNYEAKIEMQLLAEHTAQSLKTVFAVAASPSYTHRGIRPEFRQALLEKMGNIFSEDGKNYLLDTKGIDFKSPFYSSICNHRLERVAERFALKHI